MAVIDNNPPARRIRIEGRHFLGLTAPMLSPVFLLKKLALHPPIASWNDDRRKCEEATRVM